MEVKGEGLEDQGDTENHVGAEGVGADVWVAALEELDEHEDGDEVHEGGVKLEGEGGGADVVDGGHDAFHDQGGSQGVVHACKEVRF